jgi:hypothetical protein
MNTLNSVSPLAFKIKKILKNTKKVGYTQLFSLSLAFLFAACLSRIPRIFTLLAAAFSYRLCFSSGVRVIYATFLPKAQISQSSTKAERDNCPLWASIILRASLLKDSDVLIFFSATSCLGMLS